MTEAPGSKRSGFTLRVCIAKSERGTKYQKQKEGEEAGKSGGEGGGVQDIPSESGLVANYDRLGRGK